jgi:hypothetical protein
LSVFSDAGTASPFSDLWQNEIRFSLDGQAQTFDSGGNWVSPGPTETFAGAFNVAASPIIGASCSFRKQFPATPSSLTFTFTAQTGIVGQPGSFSPTPVGTGVFVAANGAGNFFCRVLAS